MNYDYPYNVFLTTIDRFTNPDTRTFADELRAKMDAFLSKLSCRNDPSKRHQRLIGVIMNALPDYYDIKKCSATDICYIKREAEHDCRDIHCFHVVEKMVLEILLHHGWTDCIGDFCGSMFEKDCRKYLPLEDEDVGRFFFDAVATGRSLRKFRLFLAATQSGKRSAAHVQLLSFDMDDEFCQELLLEYHTHASGKAYFHANSHKFLENFARSLGFVLPSSVEGFNAETLIRQCRFFSAVSVASESETRYFYIYLMVRQGQHASISIADGLNVEFIGTKLFLHHYEEGYRAVLIHPNEPVPESDRWAAMPNGLENLTATPKSYNIFLIDFAELRSEPAIKDALKTWTWAVANMNLRSRQYKVRCIISFFQYRANLRAHHLKAFLGVRNPGIDADKKIFAEEVAGFAASLKDLSSSYTGEIFSAMKQFFQYLKEQGVCDVDEAAFQFLTLRNTHASFKHETVDAVGDEDYEKLIHALEQRAHEKTSAALYYIIFCLNSITQLRITSILDLDYDCIVETARKGLYAVRVRTKTGGYSKQDVQVTPEAVKLIRLAIQITQPVREKAPEELKHFLFLVHSRRFIYNAIPAGSYYGFLKIVCRECGIARCSASSLRKRYMTKVVENAIKKNVSLLNLKPLTGHESIQTTEMHYVQDKIVNFLEATKGVPIGVVEIRGEVSAKYEGKNEDLVEHDCGYCRNPSCNIAGTAPCLMCSKFITTPKHIKDFEEAISILDHQIESATPHDREHLVSVKQLYVGYLAVLYETKEGKENVSVG